MKYLLLALLLIANTATAQSIGMNLPSASRASGSDEIRTSSGSTCRQATGSDLNLEFGMIGTDSDKGMKDDYRDFTEGAQGSAVYGRITYALGAKPRLDCKRMMDLEIEALRLELEMLKANSFVLD